MNHTRVQIRSAKNVQIVTLLIEGLSPKEIAPKVDLQPDAVRKRLERLRHNLGVQTNTALVGRVLEARWKNRQKSREAA